MSVPSSCSGYQAIVCGRKTSAVSSYVVRDDCCQLLLECNGSFLARAAFCCSGIGSNRFTQTQQKTGAGWVVHSGGIDDHGSYLDAVFFAVSQLRQGSESFCQPFQRQFLDRLLHNASHSVLHWSCCGGDTALFSVRKEKSSQKNPVYHASVSAGTTVD